MATQQITWRAFYNALHAVQTVGNVPDFPVQVANALGLRHLNNSALPDGRSVARFFGDVARAWEHFSGNDSYPVPYAPDVALSSALDPHVWGYNNAPLWERDLYGNLRRDLLLATRIAVADTAHNQVVTFADLHAALLRVTSDGSTNAGICWQVAEQLGILSTVCNRLENGQVIIDFLQETSQQWPRFSGNAEYPVPAARPNSTPDRDYATLARWEGRYGADRRDLLAFWQGVAASCAQ